MSSSLHRYKVKKIFIPFSVLLLYMACILIKAEFFEHKEDDIRFWGREVQNALIEEEVLLLDFLDKSFSNQKPDFKSFESSYYSLFVYHKDSLIYYNDHKIITPDIEQVVSRRFTISTQNNGCYDMYLGQYGEYLVLSFIPIQFKYTIDNKYFKTRMARHLDFNVSLDISNDQNAKYRLYSSQGHFLIGIDALEYKRLFHWFDYFTLFVGLVFFLSLLYSIDVFIYSLQRAGKGLHWLISIISSILVLRYTSIYFKFPGNLYELEIFEPQYFSSSNLWYSLGDALINIILFIYIFWVVFRWLKSYQKNEKLKFRLLIVGILTHFILFEWLGYFVTSLILDSNIEINIDNFFEFNMSNAIFLVIIAGLIVLVYILYSWLEVQLNHFKSKDKKHLLWLVLIGLSWAVISFYFKKTSYIIEPVYIDYVNIFPGLGGLFLLINAYYLNRFSYINRAFYFICFFSVFFSLIIISSRELKGEDKKARIIQKIGQGRNPLLEYQIGEIVKEVVSRDTLFKLYVDQSCPITDLIDHLNTDYIKDELSDWKFHRLSIPYDMALFHNMDTLDINNGHLFWLQDSMLVSTYIVGFTSAGNEEIFYFKLSEKTDLKYKFSLNWLKDQRHIDLYEKASGLNYAIYYQERLKYSFGEYAFPVEKSFNSLNIGQEKYIEFNGAKYLVYKVNNHHAILIQSSPPDIKTFISVFSYLFSFLFLEAVLLFGLFYFVVKALALFPFLYSRLPTLNILLRNKIHLLTILVLMVSFILVGWNTMLNVQNEFEKYHEKRMMRKVNSVIRHTDFNKERIIKKITDRGDMTILDQLSEANAINLNLFSNSGNLIYTSQKEIYNKGLVSERIHPTALTEIVKAKKEKKVIKENYGDYMYYSAYFPLMGKENQLKAIVNVPYYATVNEMEGEVSSLLLNLNNLYVLLFFGITLLTSLFTYRISHSLSLINLRLKDFKLGKKNQPIQWHSNDEIGALVREYNKMSKELETSVQRLAKSERESAWREMARQIAHEIKNPLTPMKLSIQHLSRAVKDNKGNVEEMVAKVARTMVEQIDHLSLIASEFSSFARMPQASNEILDLSVECENIMGLFDHDVKIRFVDLDDNIKAYVYMDKGQLIRLLTNLIKNAVHATQEMEDGEIILALKEVGHDLEIIIEDNGVGVPEEMRLKIFEPNFTTKSSGTGLGLAMCRSIVMNAQGDIWMESLEMGSSFHVRLPKYEKK